MKQFLILASTFIFASCVDIERGNPEDPGSRNYNVNRLSSSLSVEVSSSSEPSSSSSSVPQSSSSVVASSSSAAVSSSSSMLSSSSSALPSSSSVEASSSSLVESSPSSMSSSSSSALSSSSSVEPSSSSAMPSSSSSMLSSSSSALPSSSSVAASSSSVCTANDNTETHYCSNGTMKKYGSVTDDNGQSYKTVEIGTQTWMAENLNYNVSGSICQGERDGSVSTDSITKNCKKYGRLYHWAMALDLSTSCNSSTCSQQISKKHRGICPSGWHIPNSEDGSTLLETVGGFSTAGRHLKTINGWSNPSSYGVYGMDTYGFSGLPGGCGHIANYCSLGRYGRWWSNIEFGDYDAIQFLTLSYDSNTAGFSELAPDHKGSFLSVRCLRN